MIVLRKRRIFLECITDTNCALSEMLANLFSKLLDLCPLLLENFFSLTGQITHWSLTVAEEEFLHHVATRSTHFWMEKRRSVLIPVLTQFPRIILIIISARLTCISCNANCLSNGGYQFLTLINYLVAFQTLNLDSSSTPWFTIFIKHDTLHLK